MDKGQQEIGGLDKDKGEDIKGGEPLLKVWLGLEVGI